MSSSSSSRSATPRKPFKTSSNSSQESLKPSIESLASLLIRSLVVLFLLLTSFLLALIAWFSLKSFLKVDPIIGKERVWLQYGEFKPPYAFVELERGKYGAPGESYDLSLELIVPSSQQNLATGNFMVSLSLLNGDNEMVLNNSRPAILTHPIYPRFSHVLPLRPIPPPVQSLHLPLLESVSLNRNSWSTKRVERILVEVGRKDAHTPPYSSVSGGGQIGMYEGGNQLPQKIGGGGGGGGELQVYESWLKIEVKLYGLRALIRSHPYLSFLFFFPTFLLTELLAALSVYAYFVLRPSISDGSESQELREVKREFEDEDEELVERVEEQEKEIKREIKEESEEEELLTSEPPSVVTETEEEEESLESEERFRRERRRERLMREAGPGGKGMSEIQGESRTETEGDEEEEGESGEGSEEWEGVAVPPSGEEAEVREKDFDETATIGGSETTRATRSTFGPSVAGTSSTRTTATSASTRALEGLRERQGKGGGEE